MAINPVQDIASPSVSGRPAQSGSPGAAIAPAASDSVSVSSGNGSAQGLYAASVSLAQLGSLLQVASTGTERINAILGQLQQLAQQAQGSGASNAQLAQLNGEFQQILSGIDQVAAGTSFGGNSLLNGAFNPSATDNSALAAAIEASGQDASGFSPALPSLTATNLFGNTAPDISTQQAAQAASAALAGARETVNAATAAIDTAQGNVGFASASVEAALANTAASSATLGEGDFTSAIDMFAGTSSAPGASASAQTGNLPSSLLALLHA